MSVFCFKDAFFFLYKCLFSAKIPDKHNRMFNDKLELKILIHLDAIIILASTITKINELEIFNNFK